MPDVVGSPLTRSIKMSVGLLPLLLPHTRMRLRLHSRVRASPTPTQDKTITDVRSATKLPSDLCLLTISPLIAAQSHGSTETFLRESRAELQTARLLLDSSEEKSRIRSINALGINDKRCSRATLPFGPSDIRDSETNSSEHVGALTSSCEGKAGHCDSGRLYGTAVLSRLSLVVDGGLARQGDDQAQEQPETGVRVGEASRNLRQDVAGVREVRCHFQLVFPAIIRVVSELYFADERYIPKPQVGLFVARAH